MLKYFNILHPIWFVYHCLSLLDLLGSSGLDENLDEKRFQGADTKALYPGALDNPVKIPSNV